MSPSPGVVDVWRELRAGPELASFVLGLTSFVAAAPAGDGHAVLVLPGFGGADASTRPLRHALDRLGYVPSGWGQGVNRGLRRGTLGALRARLTELASGGRVSIVGWSLGGVYAVALARGAPRHVRGVITLGSPLAGRPAPAVVPTTSIHSRADRIVPWRSSLVGAGPRREDVEVPGSHLGLGHNPAALVVIADRLHLADGSWRPFTAPRWAEPWWRGPAPAPRRGEVGTAPA